MDIPVGTYRFTVRAKPGADNERMLYLSCKKVEKDGVETANMWLQFYYRTHTWIGRVYTDPFYSIYSHGAFKTVLHDTPNVDIMLINGLGMKSLVTIDMKKMMLKVKKAGRLDKNDIVVPVEMDYKLYHIYKDQVRYIGPESDDMDGEICHGLDRWSDDFDRCEIFDDEDALMGYTKKDFPGDGDEEEGDEE